MFFSKVENKYVNSWTEEELESLLFAPHDWGKKILRLRFQTFGSDSSGSIRERHKDSWGRTQVGQQWQAVLRRMVMCAEVTLKSYCFAESYEAKWQDLCYISKLVMVKIFFYLWLV